MTPIINEPPGSPAEKCMSCGCAKNQPAPSVCMSVRAHVVPEPVPTGCRCPIGRCGIHPTATTCSLRNPSAPEAAAASASDDTFCNKLIDRTDQYVAAPIAPAAEKVVEELVTALEAALGAAEYVVKVVEDTGACGVSPNPIKRSDWLGTTMHCYAAMNFMPKARAALARAEEYRKGANR